MNEQKEIIDYSEITSTLQQRIVKLSDMLSKKRWLKANIICLEIVRDLIDLSVWLAKKG